MGFILFLNFKINNKTPETKNKVENKTTLPLENIETKTQASTDTKTTPPTPTEEKKYYYFAYGSNMDIDKMRSRTDNQSIKPISSAYINNYKLTFPRGVGNIEKSTGETLWGCLFLINQDDIYDLDVVEGYKEGRENNSYNREKITVTSPDKKTYEAYVYIQAISGGETTSQSYKNTLIKGSIDCNLPISYTEKLKNIKTQ